MKKKFASVALFLVVMFLVGLQITTQVRANPNILVESPHPIPGYYDNTWTITEPGVEQIRIHFSTIETDPYGDRIYLYDKYNNLVVSYFGTAADVWSRWVCGDTIKVRLECKVPWSGQRLYDYFGFIIDNLETRYYMPTTPIASFIHFPKDDLFVDEPILFSASQLSYDPDGNSWGITSYEWDFGDGASGTGSRVVHYYSSMGSYNVNLTVTDDDGETNITSEVVDIVGVAKNIALNPTRTGYPHPLESNSGWGGGSDKWGIVDGLIRANGLAFTGGRRPYGGSCGWRQATINFGEEKTFDRVRIWHHGSHHTPRVYKIQYWDGTDWIDVFSTTNNTQGRISSSLGGIGDSLVEDSFSPVTASKVRIFLNNCDLCHGWIYEFEVYEPLAAINQPPIAICKDIEIFVDENCEATIVAEDVDGGSYDPDEDDTITLSVDNTGPFSANPVPYIVNLTVTDNHGVSDACEAKVTVVDTMPPEIFIYDPICVNVGKGKGKMANKLTVSFFDNCLGEVGLTIDNVEIFNNGGKLVIGKGVYDIIGNDIYAYPNSEGWSICVTITATDSSGNSSTERICKSLLKCKK